ncbi:MAG: cyanophycin synthetase, partial [Candidatus Competibacteraceae bacterium]|nr:cyanophycin synthetase [Candidatus Competibacteraceae bacterium]
QVISFTLQRPQAGQFGLDNGWLARGDKPWIAAAELHFGGGTHNLANALAALAMGQALGLERSAMLAALKDFQGLPHRTRKVAEAGGVAWYDDSKGTNVGATLAAVAGMPGPVVLIAGGDGKGQDFTPLRQVLADKVRAVVLIGRDGPLMAAALEGTVACYFAPDMTAAVQRAGELARPGDSVLLSPACASFDMFRNYQERGAVFAAAVLRRLG